MAHKEARLKMTNTKLNKLKFAPKNKTGTTLSISRKHFTLTNWVINYFQQQDKKLK